MRIVTLVALAFMMVTSAAQARVVQAARHPVRQHHVTVLTRPHVVVGMASWYGLHDGSGKVTATGKPFNPYAMGVAHASWPFGTRVRMTAVGTGLSVIVTVTDRTGPGVARNGRVFDLYYGAARALGIVNQGAAMVRAEPLGMDDVREAYAGNALR